MIVYKLKGAKMSRSLVQEFLALHPEIDGYTLICVCEEINRITHAGGVQVVLRQALLYPRAEKYLVDVCGSFKALENA
jgi:hypothetical protein